MKSILILSSIFLLLACSPKWSKLIAKGSYDSETAKNTVRFDRDLGLVILPVKIGDETYRFLFDTGAMLSISKELQEKFKFKEVGSGYIVDSDKARSRVQYVQMDSLVLGSAQFKKQVAFVADFKANKILKCLDLDGIVGSNIMRFCNWTIDVSTRQMHFGNFTIQDSTWVVPFDTDRQYNLLVTLQMKNVEVRNVKIDYGSNGGITMKSSDIEILKDNRVVKDYYVETGSKNSGLLGKTVEIKRTIAYLDTISMGNVGMKDVALKSGTSTLFGTGILSDYTVSIDWQNQRLLLNPIDKRARQNKVLGFKLGYNAERGFFIQSVTEGSVASSLGIKPEMRVKSIDNLYFEQGATYCDFIDHIPYMADSVRLEFYRTPENLDTAYIAKKRLH